MGPLSIPVRKISGKNYANSSWILFKIHGMIEESCGPPHHLRTEAFKRKLIPPWIKKT
jgi:hypothetical protein